MGAPILSLARLLSLPPAERRSILEKAARETETAIERLKRGPLRVGYGRSRHSRNYQLQSLYAQRQQLIALDREAGCEGVVGEPKEAA